jgi:sugar/nucleoside kinase (ribokinase family)
MLETTRIVDVVSPNDDELAGFFLDANRSEQNLEEQAKILVTSGVGVRGDGAVVVRAGKRGCYVASRESQWWLPAYYSPGDSSENHPAVIDPTGGGNAFMGGLGIGLVRNHGNLLLAAAWGIVAASFAIEQIGIPELNNNNSDIGEETWNGVKVMDRIESYKARLKTIGIDLDSAG